MLSPLDHLQIAKEKLESDYEGLLSNKFASGEDKNFFLHQINEFKNAIEKLK